MSALLLPIDFTAFTSRKRVLLPRAQPQIVSVPEDEDGEARDFDQKSGSLSSTSTWGADKITPKKQFAPRQPRVAPTPHGKRREPARDIMRYSREPPANPKFNARLRLAEPTIIPPLEEDRENEPPEPPSAQADPQQEELQGEDVCEDTWRMSRMSIQTNDIPIPGSYFRKHYVVQDDGNSELPNSQKPFKVVPPLEG